MPALDILALEGRPTPEGKGFEPTNFIQILKR